MNRTHLFLLVSILLIAVVACGQQTEPKSAEADPLEADAVETAVSGKFLPPSGKTLFIIGQDNGTIADYMEANPEPEPGGVTSYTSLKRLEGLDKFADYGGGPLQLTELAEDHPDSVLVLGLYMVDILGAVSDGRADKKIDQLLDHLAAYERPVFLRFGYEFDGEWNYYDSEIYKEAWIYFYNRMQEKEIDNIALVWQSATFCGGTYQDKPIEAWYPGDEYVDWIGFSYFVQQECDLEPIKELVAFAREHDKPVISAETAPQGYETGKLTYSQNGKLFEDRTATQIWDEWYVPFLSYVDENRDVIRAVAYINAYWDKQGLWGYPYYGGYWGDSRVQANDTILEQWQAELAKDKWLHGSEDLFEALGYE